MKHRRTASFETIEVEIIKYRWSRLLPTMRKRERIKKNQNLLISINLRRCKHFCLRATTCVAFHYIWIIIMCHTVSIQVPYRIFISFFHFFFFLTQFFSLFFRFSVWEIFVDSIWIQHVNTFYFVQPNSLFSIII